jgi:hypothetical protein
MTQITVELVFGEKAGAVWRALNQNGPSNITNLVKTTSMSREEVFSAMGWLGREDKILLEQKGREMIFSLRDPQARQEAAAETAAEVTAKITMEEIAPKAKTKSKTKRTKAKPPKKPKKIEAVKASKKQEESQEESLDKESDRTKNFLLH